MSDLAWIEVLSGEAKGKRFDLDPHRPNQVGSSRTSTVRLLDKGVFFKHARLEATDAGWVLLEGLASAKVAVNGEPLAPGKGRLLVDGDRLVFADVIEAVFHAGASRPSAVALDDASPAAELVRARERGRVLADEVVALTQRLCDGELGRLRLELEQAREERDAAQQRAARLEDSLQALVLRHNDQEQAYDVVYRAKLMMFKQASAEMRTLLEGDAIRAGLAGEKRKLEQDVADLRRALEEQEAAALAQADALRRRVAALETSEGAARETLAALQEELRDSEVDLRDAREALARLQ